MKTNYLQQFNTFTSSCHVFYIKLMGEDDCKKVVPPFSGGEIVKISSKKLDYKEFRKQAYEKMLNAKYYLRRVFAEYEDKEEYFLSSDLAITDFNISEDPRDWPWKFEYDDDCIVIFAKSICQTLPEELNEDVVDIINETIEYLDDCISAIFKEFEHLEYVLERRLQME